MFSSAIGRNKNKVPVPKVPGPLEKQGKGREPGTFGTGTLFIVPTPIGNLKDVTLRALEVLKSADWIAAEDTRETQKLLAHHNLRKENGNFSPLISLHEHTGGGRIRKILAELREGKTVALVSESGTPLVSDPGFELVHAAFEEGIRIEVLPGPSALVTALVASGLAVDAFSFLGFLPAKSAARRKKLASLEPRFDTLIFYESPFRLIASLADMKEILGDREACICRELTKKFEEVSRGRVGELIEKFSKGKIRGEIVVLVAGKDRKETLPKRETA